MNYIGKARRCGVSHNKRTYWPILLATSLGYLNVLFLFSLNWNSKMPSFEAMHHLYLVCSFMCFLSLFISWPTHFIVMTSINWAAGKLSDCRSTCENGFSFCTRSSVSKNSIFFSLDKLWFYHELSSLGSIFGAIEHSSHAILLKKPCGRMSLATNNHFFF